MAAGRRDPNGAGFLRGRTLAPTVPRKHPNNYFHVRVYTDNGSKIEIFRDRKEPHTRQQIVDGLRRAIETIEAIDKPKAEGGGQ
jgi:hypothetical protein